MNYKFLRQAISGIALSLSIGLGPANANADLSPEVVQGLEARARAFWEARVAGDVITMYQYEKLKATGEVTLQDYVRRRGGMLYRKAEVLDFEVGSDGEARVKVSIEAQITGLPGPYRTVVSDRWVNIDGEWYHAPLPPRLGGS
jgi:hypothetical protein